LSGIYKKGVGKSACYSIEALDCPSYIISKNPRRIDITTSAKQGLISLAWAFLAHYPYDRIVQIPIEDNFAKRPKLTCLFMAKPMNVTKLDKRILARKKSIRKYRMEF